MFMVGSNLTQNVLGNSQAVPDNLGLSKSIVGTSVPQNFTGNS